MPSLDFLRETLTFMLQELMDRTVRGRPPSALRNASTAKWLPGAAIGNEDVAHRPLKVLRSSTGSPTTRTCTCSAVRVTG
jgi:hypothetical protein